MPDYGATWTDDRFDVAAARARIRSALPGAPEVTGPIRVYRAKGWGVTAAFGVAPSGGVAAPAHEGQNGRDGPTPDD